MVLIEKGGANPSGGVIDWYKRRYKRILAPYLLIAGISSILAITRGGSVLTAILNISTVTYWLNHQGAWYIAMLIPLYAITPAYDMFLKKVRQPGLFTVGLVIAIVGLSSVHVPIADVAIANIQENIRHVAVHLPPFFIGFMLAPMAKAQKNVSLFWMIIVPLFITAAMKFWHFGYWPGFLVFIFVPILCWVLKHCGKMINSIFEFFGKISLESYLFNTTVGSWIIAYLPFIYYSTWNKGCYLHYALVCVIGTLLAYMVHQLCKKVFFKS